MSRLFDTLEAAPPDAILGLNEAFRADDNPDKVNLSVGVYKDADGATPVLSSVKSAEDRILNEESTKSYLGIDGLSSYVRVVPSLLFGSATESLGDRPVCVQTPGGTGALRVAADFLRARCGRSRIWCSRPTWANHHAVFQAAGMETSEYTYFEESTSSLDFDGLMDSIRSMEAGDVMCLHPCCHNPTGVDPTVEQWEQIADAVAAQGVLPLLDFAYQGFGHGLDEDSAGLREFCRPEAEFVVCNSFSKNFSLYRERVGAVTVVVGSEKAAGPVLSHLKGSVRSNYSNPPAHGAVIVATILEDSSLRAEWENELSQMRDRINAIRRQFVTTMNEMGAGDRFDFLQQQVGMFSYSGLTPTQVDRLREEFSVYMVRNGRMNVAGLTESNLQRVCEAVSAVL